MPNNLVQTMKEICRKTAVTPLTFMDAMLPVATGARPASLLFVPQLDHQKVGMRTFKGADIERESWYTTLKREAQSKLGVQIGAIIFIEGTEAHQAQNGGNQILKNPVFYRDAGTLEEIKALNSFYSRLLTTVRNIAYAENMYEGKRKEGHLLGIPQCCIDSYIDAKRSQGFMGVGMDIIERKASQELRAIAPTLEDVARLPEDVLLRYWAQEVYPCSPQCQAAEGIGRRIVDSIDDDQIRGIYRDMILISNAETIHTPLKDRAGGDPFALVGINLAYQADMNRQIMQRLS